jgi:hypothetical protein
VHCFLDPAQVFFDRSVPTIPPFCFNSVSLSLDMYDYEPLFRLVGSTDAPSLQLIASWLNVLSREALGQPLDDQGFACSVSLLELYVERAFRHNASTNDNNGDAASVDDNNSNSVKSSLTMLLAPDTTRTLRPCRSLVLDDAPWLEGRIDRDAVFIAHPQIKNLTDRLGIGGLSREIDERLEPGFEPTPCPADREVDQWAANMQTVQFRNGLKRILRHEQLELGHP